MIFFKPIADMFYSLAILDYAMMAVALVFFLLSFRKIRVYHVEDCLVFAFMILLCSTLIRSRSGFNHFIKMLSAFMLYFIGRGFYKDVPKAEKGLVAGNYVVLLTNLAMFVLGIGFVVWGNARTFRGSYFYKTDFSIAMVYVIASFLFLQNPPKLMALAEWAVILFLVVLSNTRAALLILVLVFGLWILYLRERETKKSMKITLKYALAVLVGVFAAIFIVMKILSLPMFENYHFITFRFNKLSDLLNASNTQGRNVIWANLLETYRHASWTEHAIGIDFISDVWNGYDAHNAYLKILFSTGYIGLGTFVAFILVYVSRMNRLTDRSLFYFNLSILLTFLMQSMSQVSIDFTQMTWVFMFFAGAAVSESYKRRTIQYHFNREMRLRW